jgi:hypothetical protein
MKIIKKNHSMVIFLCCLIFFSSALSQEESNVTYTIDDSEIEDFQEIINNLIFEQGTFESTISSYKDMLSNFSVKDVKNLKNLKDGVKSIEDDFLRAKNQVEKLSQYILDITKELNISRTEDVKGFENFNKIMRLRRKNGLSTVNKLLKNFLFINDTQKNLQELQKIFANLNSTVINETATEKKSKKPKDSSKKPKEIGNKTNKRIKNIRANIDTSLRTDIQVQQYNRLRLHSSFRLDEIINNINIEDAKGEDVIRSAMVSLMSNIPPAFCWVHDKKLALTQAQCEGKFQRKGSICMDECEEDQMEIGGLCLSKCPPDQTDCDLFCSKSDCNSPQDFSPKYSSNIEINFSPKCPDGYTRKGNLCYPVCEEIGMVSCGDRTCALSKNICTIKSPDVPKNVVEAFVNYLGHIYSVQSNKNFGWSDPESLTESLSIMESFRKGNTDALQEMAKIFIKMISGTMRKLFAQVNKNVEKQANSFFKTKDNTPLSLMFKWADFSDMFMKFYVNLDGLEKKKPNQDKQDGLNFDVCEMKNFKRSCFVRFQKFINRAVPVYLLGLLSRFVKPLCPFDINYA